MALHIAQVKGITKTEIDQSVFCYFICSLATLFHCRVNLSVDVGCSNEVNVVCCVVAYCKKSFFYIFCPLDTFCLRNATSWEAYYVICRHPLKALETHSQSVIFLHHKTKFPCGIFHIDTRTE